tara:strand:- start:10872 stop:11063 length:192 start_codon:yes stop_codon:yes gene_type:complete
MSYELKTFKVDETINKRFKEEISKIGNVTQGGILNQLMSRWVRMKQGTDKRNANIYKDGKEKS